MHIVEGPDFFLKFRNFVIDSDQNTRGYVTTDPTSQISKNKEQFSPMGLAGAISGKRIIVGIRLRSIRSD